MIGNAENLSEEYGICMFDFRVRTSRGLSQTNDKKLSRRRLSFLSLVCRKKSILQFCDTLHLYQPSKRQLCHLDTGTSREVPSKIGLINLVNRCKVVHIG